MSTRILHLSDLHFGTERPGAMKALFDAVERLDPAAIVLSGDITQRARRHEFRAARAFVERLAPRPVLAVPGNHDISLFNPMERLLTPYIGFRRFSDDLRPRIRLPQVELIGFVSALWYRHVDGELDPGDCEARLAELDDGAPLRIAVLHHPFDCRQGADEHNLIHNAQPLLEAFAAQRVALVLGGHIHDPYVVSARERYRLPAQLPAPVLALAGTCLSHRTRFGAPNSFNVIDFRSGAQPAFDVVRHDLADAEGPFAPVSTSSFALIDGDWRALSPTDEVMHQVAPLS